MNTVKIPSKHSEVNKDLSELKSLMKEIQKKEERAKNDLDAFVCARQRAATSFFAVMRPRLRKQNPMKYIERSVLDKDLLILKKALANKIPVEETRDWELPFIIEHFKNSQLEIYM